MVKGNVVLVLGAGASEPYGFPLGLELKNLVLNRSGIAGPDSNPYIQRTHQRFRDALRASLNPSVDAFLFLGER